MYKHKYSTFFTVCLTLFGIGTSSGCSDIISTHNSNRRGDFFCNGNSISVVITKAKRVGGNIPRAHSGGYLISETEDSWLVNWTMQEEGTVNKPVVNYVGKYEHERANRGSEIVKQEGVSGSSILGTGKPDLVVILGKQLRVLDHRVDIFPEHEILPDETAGRNRYIFTRTRKHVFSWNPTPAIYSLPNMKMVRELEPSDSFNEFKELYNWRENVSVILTEDLSYLIAVPHNGAAESTRGAQHTKAFCYRTDRDEVSTVSLNGLGEASIRDAEMLDGELRWLVSYHSLKAGKWSILDSQSHIFAEFSLPRRSQNQKHARYWDPKNNLIWIVKFAPQNGNISEAFSVIKHNVSDGTRVEIPLPAFDESQLVVPE